MKNTWILLALLAGTLIACGGGDSNNNDNNEGTITFQIRAVHASPDAGVVDIYISGAAEAVIPNVPYGAASAFLDVPQGVYNVAIRAAGADPASTPVFEETNIDLSANEATITVIAAGFVGGGMDDGFRLLKLAHDFDTPGAGEAIVRIVHAGADAPSVKIDVGDDGNSEINDLQRFADTGAAGVPLPAGTELQVGIRTEVGDTRVTAFTTPALPAGAELFVIATGELSALARAENGFSLLAVAPTAALPFIKQNPIVYALHAGANAPPVQVFTGGLQLTDTIAFGELSDPIQVPPGSYPLTLKVASNQADALMDTTPTLEAGQRYLAIATGLLGSMSEPLTIQYLAEQFNIDDGTALAVIVHSSPDAPDVEVGAVDMNMFTPLGLPALSYLGATSDPMGTPIGVSPITVGLRVAGTMDPPAASFDLAPAAGLRAYAIAVGSLTNVGGNSEPFALAIVNTASTPWTIAVLAPNPLPTPN